MSKHGIEKLNQELLHHYKESGVTKALYYEPFSDSFWSDDNKVRVVCCNLEPYDPRSIWPEGYHKVTADVFTEGWENNRTIRYTMKLTKFFRDMMEGKSFSFADVKKTYSSEELFSDFINCAYLNIGFTFSQTIAQNSVRMRVLYSDPFYLDFLKRYLEEFKDDKTDTLFLFTGRDSNNLINRIYPDLKLPYDGNPVWQKNSQNQDKYLFVSMKHPSGQSGAHFSNVYMYEILQRIKNNW